MPLYLYGCDRCGKTQEEVQHFSDEPPVCCGVPMTRRPTCPAKIEVRGSNGIRQYSKGYKEDYAKDYRRRLAAYQDAKT